jgi:hypothetical protein
MPTPQANALRRDLGVVDKHIKVGVNSQRAKAMDNRWARWDALYVARNIDPYLRTWDDPSPSFKSLESATAMVDWPPPKTPPRLAQWRTHFRPWARRTPDRGGLAHARTVMVEYIFESSARSRRTRRAMTPLKSQAHPNPHHHFHPNSGVWGGTQ